MQLQQKKKKLFSGLSMLISCKSMSLPIINYLKTHLSNIYNKLMHLPQTHKFQVFSS